MKVSCNIILDLIPLVKDGIASEDSNRLVQEHMIKCESCKQEYGNFEQNPLEKTSIKDDRILFNIKRSIFISQIIILIIGSIIGVALSNSMGMFYNFLIMPIVGSISFIIFARRWYLGVFGIYVFTYVWQTIEFFLVEGFQWPGFYVGLFYSVIYSALVIIGVIITALLKFAFRREGEGKL